MTPDLVQPLGTRVLVRVLVEDKVTASGLVIPDTAQEKGQRGEVVAVGDAEEIKVAVGDTVLYSRYAGTELAMAGQDYLLVNAADLLAVLRPAGASASAA